MVAFRTEIELAMRGAAAGFTEAELAEQSAKVSAAYVTWTMVSQAPERAPWPSNIQEESRLTLEAAENRYALMLLHNRMLAVERSG